MVDICIWVVYSMFGIVSYVFEAWDLLRARALGLASRWGVYFFHFQSSTLKTVNNYFEHLTVGSKSRLRAAYPGLRLGDENQIYGSGQGCPMRHLKVASSFVVSLWEFSNLVFLCG